MEAQKILGPIQNLFLSELTNDEYSGKLLGTTAHCSPSSETVEAGGGHGHDRVWRKEKKEAIPPTCSGSGTLPDVVASFAHSRRCRCDTYLITYLITVTNKSAHLHVISIFWSLHCIHCTPAIAVAHRHRDLGLHRPTNHGALVTAREDFRNYVSEQLTAS